MPYTVHLWQKPVLLKIEEKLDTSKKPTVLAASCGFGKTVISIILIDRYLKQNQGHRVLILTEGQKILQRQYIDAIKETGVGFTQSDNIESDTQVVITLPQQKAKKSLPHFDLVIVDEAHNRYHGPEVQKIIKKVKPRHQLLLSATPAKFNLDRDKYEIEYFSMEESYDAGQIAEFVVEVASTTYGLRDTDYDREENVTRDFKFTESATRLTLDQLLDQLYNRLTLPSNPSSIAYKLQAKLHLNKVADWLTVLRDKKTMIACRSRAQAIDVKRYFNENGVGCAMSISHTNTTDDDLESESTSESADQSVKTFDTFKDDKKCLVLIVVGRGILGFNFPKLVNVVDLTCSRNLNRIYQLMGRVTRKSGISAIDGNKLFIKVVPDTDADYFEYVMNAALFLIGREGISTFNGKNFLDFRFKAPRLYNKKPKLNDDPLPPSKVKNVKKRVITPHQRPDFAGMPVLRFFKDLYHRNHAKYNAYAWTCMREVRMVLLFNQNPEGKKQEILEFCEKTGHRPNKRSVDEQEKRLGEALSSYTSSGHYSYDKTFKDKIDKLYPPRRDSVAKNKQDILEFGGKYGRRPRLTYNDLEERKLAIFLGSYSSPNHPCYDKAFKDKIDKLYPREPHFSLDKADISGWIKYVTDNEFVSVTDWRKRHPSSYKRAYTLGIHIVICDKMGWDRPGVSKWNSPKDIVAHLKQQRIHDKSEWRGKDFQSYARTKTLKIIKNVNKLMGW